MTLDLLSNTISYIALLGGTTLFTLFMIMQAIWPIDDKEPPVKYKLACTAVWFVGMYWMWG